MGFLKNLFDIFTAVNLTDKFGPGAGIMYSEIAGERTANKQRDKAVAKVNKFITENRHLLNETLVNEIHTKLSALSTASSSMVPSMAQELSRFIEYKCGFFMMVNELMNNATQSIMSIPDEDIEDEDRNLILKKIREIKRSADSEEVKRLYKELFDSMDEHGVTVENKKEMLDKIKQIERDTLLKWV